MLQMETGTMRELYVVPDAHKAAITALQVTVLTISMENSAITSPATIAILTTGASDGSNRVWRILYA